MGNKKTEHILFDRMNRIKDTNIKNQEPISIFTKQNSLRAERRKAIRELKRRPIYFIGGSPCSGKSTIAELLSREYSLGYYKCDDHLERYIKEGAALGSRICQKFLKMNRDEEWLERTLAQQVQDELAFYKDIFPLVLDDIFRYPNELPLIVEGAGLLPELMHRYQLERSRYYVLLPEFEFQKTNYKKREWVPNYLADCSQPDKAFENWMLRDNEFAKHVKRNAIQRGYKHFEVDGIVAVEDVYKNVRRHFFLGKVAAGSSGF